MTLIVNTLRFLCTIWVLILSTQSFLFGEKPLWSLSPIKQVVVPINETTDWGLNSIDKFILRKLSEKSLSPAERANRRSIIRRASYDLTGLPPTPETVSEFLDDPGDDAIAFAKVVDKLLESKA